MTKRLGLITFIFILVLGFILRLYRFDNPIGDWHAFRQADTSSVSKVFVENGINLLHPTYFDISNIQSGADNPKGYRMVEFPIYNVFQAVGFQTIGVLTLEEWGRIISIGASLLSITFIYLLVRKHLDTVSALFASFFFAVLPFSVFYGRTILPDPSTAAAILGGIYFFDKWIETRGKFPLQYLVLAVFFTAAAFLLKPFALFFTLPMVYLAYKHFGWKVVLIWQLYLFALLSLTPLALWRMWIMQYPEGIPASNWLFNEGNIRFTGAFFHWIFAERISKLILGYFGVVLLFLGLFKRSEKDYLFFLSFLVSSLIYITVIARGNVQHDYYQILIIPTLCIFLGRGASLLISLPAKLNENLGINTLVSYGSLVVVTGFMLLFSWFYVRDYFNINNRGLITAGVIADKVLPKNAKVIAVNDGDTSFLYYINRKGWPAYEHGPDELKLLGATHIVIPSPTQQDKEGLGKTYKTVYSSPEVLILKL